MEVVSLNIKLSYLAIISKLLFCIKVSEVVKKDTKNHKSDVKEMLHPKIKILSLFTHIHTVPNVYDLCVTQTEISPKN